MASTFYRAVKGYKRFSGDSDTASLVGSLATKPDDLRHSHAGKCMHGHVRVWVRAGALCL